MPSHGDWRTRAACTNHDTAASFDPDRVDEAKAVCAQCPARTPCLADAMDVEGAAPYGRYGVRGGHTAEERSKLRKTTN